LLFVGMYPIGMNVPLAYAAGAIAMPDAAGAVPLMSVGFAWLAPLLWGGAAFVAVLLVTRRAPASADGARIDATPSATRGGVSEAA
jgi:hypothetical protein